MSLNKPKVAIVTPGTFAIPSRYSSSVERVVENVIREIDQDVEFYVFGKKQKGFVSNEIVGNIRYVRFQSMNKSAYIQHVCRGLSNIKPDIIQVENRPRYVRFIKKLLPNYPVWLSLHSITFISAPHIRSQELKACFAAADQIIVNSRFLKEYIVERFSNTFHKITVNYLGVNTAQFPSRWMKEGEQFRSERLRKLGYENKKIILYVGRLIGIKGVHHALEAMRSVIKQEPDAILIIVGSAQYGSHAASQYVRKLYRMGGTMPRNIKFIPYVSYDKIQDWFRIADIVVVPSSSNEAFGLVNVEAMSTGIPVIATKAGGIKEIVVEGETGYLVSPNRIAEELSERMLKLLSDDELRRKMGMNSRTHVESEFTWKHTANRQLSLYKELL